ncbi:MAG: bifunctional demethylmenaquinone methyltransferase/2-methoxy-6-polyprenyl-1,4-benzoquinol methylase UbiE [Gammaproteobacteria bacterium]|nr:MAG: bifunctional demethylmenaquinone methyltransferase/2-methoxy-6-polyprenyl-1,4-benzoquinol methylase UbiE [Gammaproteobacteria bacterium]
MTEKTHFGYQQVEKEQKEKLVANVFDSVADSYDIMNDIMSGGIHRFWKYYTILAADVRPDMHVLDLASGTCDLAIQMGKKLAGTGRLVASDINENMLNIGRDRMIDNGLVKHIEYKIANAESLPFADNCFDLVTMAFGLRNVTNKDKALAEIYRVLKPGGKCLVLEFSKPIDKLLAKSYDFYSFNILPKMGKIIAQDEESYRYLAESIRVHPDQETLKSMFDEAGFCITKYQNLSAGIVALHQGIKV